MAKKNYDYIISTDGGCAPTNPGPGGCSAVFRKGEDYRECVWYFPNTTNNRMELMAVIKSLMLVKEKKSSVLIRSDSNYVVQGITQWIDKWVSNNWRSSKKTPVENAELWSILLAIVHQFEYEGGKVRFQLLKGHSGDKDNERADELCIMVRDKVAK